MRSPTTSAAFVKPMASPLAKARVIAGPAPMPFCSAEIAITTDRPRLAATERSNTPAASGSTSASASRAVTAELDPMLRAVMEVGNVAGRRIENSTIIATRP